MTNRHPGPVDTAPWAGAALKRGLTRPPQSTTPARDADPCYGCALLVTDLNTWPDCLHGVDYGQRGCVRRHGD